MGWATSSWASALAALLLALPAGAQDGLTSAGGDSWRDARALLSEAMYLESGLGDVQAACDLYEEGLRLPGLDDEMEAELLFRLGSGRERMGQSDEAASAFQTLLDRHGSRRPWGDLGHQRSLRVAERIQQIDQLPVGHDFDVGVGEWLHSGGYERQGSLQWTGDVGRTAEGALLWESPVRGQVRDDIYLSFSSPSPRVERVELWVRAVDFPAHLILSLVEEGGVRFASGLYVVEPADGWTRIGSEIDDFYLFPGDDATRHPDPGNITFLVLEDATATYSTDRGQNRLLIDDVTVE